jgi:hypothetical protein
MSISAATRKARDVPDSKGLSPARPVVNDELLFGPLPECVSARARSAEDCLTRTKRSNKCST